MGCCVLSFSPFCPLPVSRIGKQPLTIEAIFAEAALRTRSETIEVSPDGTKVSFVQRDDSSDHGQLWYVDAATGEKKEPWSARSSWRRLRPAGAR